MVAGVTKFACDELWGTARTSAVGIDLSPRSKIDFEPCSILLLDLLGLHQDVLPDDAGQDAVLSHRLHVQRLRLELLDADLLVELLWAEEELPLRSIVVGVFFNPS